MNKERLQKIEYIKSLHKEGFTYRQICDIAKCSIGTVSRYCGEGQLEKSRVRGRESYTPKIILPKSLEDIKNSAKRRMLKHRYNLTEESYIELYSSQKGKCAICEELYILGSPKGLYIDHCHKTNRVRGLLCSTCNSALGKFKDSESILKRAIEYLRKT
jgi:hypothetical protein